MEVDLVVEPVVVAVDEVDLNVKYVDEVELVLVAMDEVDLVVRSVTRPTSAPHHGSDSEVDLVLVAVGKGPGEEVDLVQSHDDEVDLVHGDDDEIDLVLANGPDRRATLWP